MGTIKLYGECTLNGYKKYKRKIIGLFIKMFIILWLVRWNVINL